jgi:signal transduction histidine kinase
VQGAPAVDLDDVGRLAALHEYGLLDAPAGPDLEAVLRVAAQVAGVPTATVNLVDERRQCQITTVGFAGGDSARDESMCAVSLTIGGFMHVPDAAADPRFATNPWVTGVRGGVRFYSAAPLVTAQGYALGTLCVFDDVPRELDADRIARLQDLAQVVVGLFERRRQARVQEQLAAQADAARRELAEALRADQEHLAFLDAVLDSVEVGIVAADAAGHLSLFNRATRQWHGLDAVAGVEPVDLPRFYDLFQGDGSTPLTPDRIPVLRALRAGSVRDAEMVIAPHGRDPVVVLCTGRALTGPDGDTTGAVVAMTDVTAARAAQARLDATVAELRRSNGELQALAAVAGHDLKAPLTVVRGHLENLEEGYGDRLDDCGRRWLGAVLSATDRMTQLIDSLLRYAQAGAEVLRARPTDVGHVLDLVATDLDRHIADAGADVTRDGPLPTVHCDPVAVRQLLQNLVANALRFARPDRPPRIACSVRPVPAGWEFAVADNGPGIPAEQRERVFGMFARVPGRVTGGYGIGLATCQRIVERHGGRIWADETPGGGATIRFVLPAS